MEERRARGGGGDDERLSRDAGADRAGRRKGNGPPRPDARREPLARRTKGNRRRGRQRRRQRRRPDGFSARFSSRSVERLSGCGRVGTGAAGERRGSAARAPLHRYVAWRVSCEWRSWVVLSDYSKVKLMSLSATSLKVSRSLKARIERLARRAGESPHAFMLRALEGQVEASERYLAFLEDGLRADEAMQRSGLGYAAGGGSRWRGESRARFSGGKDPRPPRQAAKAGPVARVIYSNAALADFERIIAFLLQQAPDSAQSALGQIRGAVTVLECYPE